MSPERGIAIYAHDHTQGPACAIVCAAGTVYRNYLCNDGVGQGERQIDTLRPVADLLGTQEHFWTMQNGYALPTDAQAMARVAAKFKADEGLEQRCEEALEVGVQWDTEVMPAPHSVGASPRHRVAQVYVSAVPVAYVYRTTTSDWEPFARMVLRSAFDATLCAARVLAAERRERVTVFLTQPGGGAFGNQTQWIVDAMQTALERHRDAPLDVVNVHYGAPGQGVVPREYAEIG